MSRCDKKGEINKKGEDVKDGRINNVVSYVKELGQVKTWIHSWNRNRERRENKSVISSIIKSKWGETCLYLDILTTSPRLLPRLSAKTTSIGKINLNTPPQKYSTRQIFLVTFSLNTF